MNKYEVGDVIVASVSGIEKIWFFCKVDSEYTGLVHISSISEYYVKDINDYVSLGEEIRVRIISIDEEKKQMSLEIKGLNYKMHGRRKARIRETVHGFDTLYDNLDGWIDKKKNELLEKN